MAIFMTSNSANLINQDSHLYYQELAIRRSKACEVYNGIIDYAGKVSFDIQLSNPVVVEGIARPKKK
jgi:hypothetical protein